MKAVANASLKNLGVSITYIPTMAPMATIHPKQNLNPHDIHPTIAGNIVIADQFWKRIKNDIRFIK